MKRLKLISTLLVFFSICMISYSQNGIETYTQGISLIDEGKYEEASEVFSKGIALNDLARSANYYGRANSYFLLNKYKEAKLDINKSLTTEVFNNENMNSHLYWLKAMIAGIEEDRTKEIESYKKAIGYAPDNNSLKITFGFVLVENDQNEEAINILTEVLQGNNQDPFAYNNRALAFLNIGKLEETKLDLEASRKIDNDNPFLFKNYFFYYKKINDLERGCEALGIALQKKMSDYGEESDTKELLRLRKENCE